MTDRELLELAAKACGLRRSTDMTEPSPGLWIGEDGVLFEIRPEGGWQYWDPFVSDGDEARLEAAMCFDVAWYEGGVLVGPRECRPQTGSAYFRCYSDHAGDKQAARRYAGVLAAAYLGKAMTC